MSNEPQVGDECYLYVAEYMIACTITEMDENSGEITKFTALEKDPILGKIGFFIEGGKYVFFEQTQILAAN